MDQLKNLLIRIQKHMRDSIEFNEEECMLFEEYCELYTRDQEELLRWFTLAISHKYIVLHTRKQNQVLKQTIEALTNLTDDEEIRQIAESLREEFKHDSRPVR